MASGKRFKIACVGAGNVGASAAQYCAEMELGDVVLTDILEGFPQGNDESLRLSLELWNFRYPDR